MDAEPDAIALCDVKLTWRENLAGAFLIWCILALALALPIALLSITGGGDAPYSIIDRLIFFVIAAIAAPTVVLLVWTLIALAFWPWTRKTKVSRGLFRKPTDS